MQRTAWDDLWRPLRGKGLTPQDLLVIVTPASRAGFRPDRMSVVLGNHTERAEALGVRREALLTACRKAEDGVIRVRASSMSGDASRKRHAPI